MRIKFSISRSAIVKLFKRPWFRRVWILQEVAAAESLVVRCGDGEISGHAFCKALTSIEYLSRDWVDHEIVSQTFSVASLMDFTAMISMNGDQPSLNFHSLLKLIDMFHTHEASDPRDKVYALLNLAVHDNPAQLLRPDYELSWKQVFRQLIETFVTIDEDTKLHTWDDQRIAMIQTEGGLLGHVTEARGNKVIQSIGVEIWDTTPVRYRGRLSKYFSQGIKNFRLSRGAKDICAGDLLCVLQDTEVPIGVRLCDGHLSLIAASFPNPEFLSSENEEERHECSKSWSRILETVSSERRPVFLVWDWNDRQPTPKPTDRVRTLLSDPTQDMPNYEQRTKTISRLLGIQAHVQRIEEFHEQSSTERTGQRTECSDLVDGTRVRFQNIWSPPT